VVDKEAQGRLRNAPTPHYKAVNELPIDGMPAVLKGCFNCGESHMIRDCPYTRDQMCIRLNRYLHEKHNSKGGGGRGKKQHFGNQRYYQSASLTQSAAATSSPTPAVASANATDASPLQCTNGSFDDYLKLVQKRTDKDNKRKESKDKKKESASAKKNDEKNCKKDGSEKALAIEVDGVDGVDASASAVSAVEEGQVSDSVDLKTDESEEKGLEMTSDVQGLKILRTAKEISESLAAHKLELESDQRRKDKVMAKVNRSNKRSNRRNHMRSDTAERRGDGARGDRAQTQKTQLTKQTKEAASSWRGKRKGEALQNHEQGHSAHPGDVDHRRQRRQHTQSSRDHSNEYDRRDRDRSGHRGSSRRDERDRGRGARSRSRSGGRGRGGYGDRDRERDRDHRDVRQRREHSDEEIDYGFKKKKDRIIKYINDRYKKDKSEDRDRDRRRTHRR